MLGLPSAIRETFVSKTTLPHAQIQKIYRNERFWIREAARSLRIWLLNPELIQLDRRFLWAPLMMGAGGAS